MLVSFFYSVFLRRSVLLVIPVDNIILRIRGCRTGISKEKAFKFYGLGHLNGSLLYNLSSLLLKFLKWLYHYSHLN